ncbi:MAG: GNAT family N-acetyltransferase [Vicinamibacterales bacterium]
MEKNIVVGASLHTGSAGLSGANATEAWRTTPPVLRAGGVVLREVDASDAPRLWSLLRAPEVTRFISPPPGTVDGFERFIAASQRLRAAGQGACFAVTLEGSSSAVGIFQVRHTPSALASEHQFGDATGTGEWGFAIGAPYWGAGVFRRGAPLLINFAFEELGLRRLEARAAASNGRGAGALRTVGAVPAAILRNALICDEGCVDQVLYTILASEWQMRQSETRTGSVAWVH